jgi:drug/metabolite transporter (DMT)-like permease
MTGRRPILAALAAALLFGVSTPIAKALLGHTDPLALAGLLYLGGALGALPACFRGGSLRLARRRREQAMLLGATLFGGVLGPVLLLTGLSRAPAASVSLWLNFETPATALLAALFFREHVGRRGWGAIAIVMAGGAALAVGPAAPPMGAVLLVALACFCWGLDNNLTANLSGFTPAQTTFVKAAAAGTINLLLASILGQRLPAGAVLVGAVLLGVASYGLSIQLYVSAAQELGASRSQLLFSTSPFLGTAAAWVLLGEPVEPLQLVAALLMAGGLAWLFTARHEHAHRHEPLAHTHAHRHDDGHHPHDHPGLAPAAHHTHPHVHDPVDHAHAHVPDLHHRHLHEKKTPTGRGGRDR